MAALPLGRAGVHSCIRCLSTAAGFQGGQTIRCRAGQIRSRIHETQELKTAEGPTPQGVQDLLRKAAKAEVEAKAAGLKAKRAKAQFKMCRKAFRKLKRLAKQARKDAKAGAKAFKSGKARRSASTGKTSW